jgi:hypothetical protein
MNCESDAIFKGGQIRLFTDAVSSAFFLLLILSTCTLLAIVFVAVGCESATKLDPGTAKGSYIVAANGAAGSGPTSTRPA